MSEQSSTTSYLCLGWLLFAAIAPVPGEAAEFRLQPYITVSQDYTDNAYLVPKSANPLSDWTTRLAPGAQMTYKAPLWDWDAAFTYDYRHHTEHVFRTDSNEKVPSAHLASLVRVVPEFLFLDVRDDYARTSITPARDYTQESSFVNQTDRNVFSVSPYTTTRMSDRTMLYAGYVYRNTWYKDPLSIDTIEHEGYADLKRDVSQRLAVNGGVRYTQNKNDVRLFAKTDISLGQTYAYAEGSSLAATIGYSRFHFGEGDRTPREIFWNALETHRSSTVTLLFDTGRSYVPDPRQILRRADRVVATVRKDTERTAVSVSGGVWKYNNAVTKELENASHRADATAYYRITQHTNITGSFTLERLDDAVARTRTLRHSYGLRLDQAASETLFWALDYRYGQAEDHVAYFNNYRSNRFLAEVRKNF